jgi:serine/threonine protein kinase
MKPELEALLLDWEERRERGEVVSVEMLSTLDAQDQAELRRQAQLLEACDRLLGESRAEEDLLPELQRVPETVGPYKVHGILGRGGMGVVYAGWDPILQRRVALKMLWPVTPWLAEGERDRLSRRFSQEAQVLAQLNHPHIVPVYAATVEASGCCIVMEQVRGGSLGQHRARLMESGPYAIAAFMEKVARAVHHAHSHGILHRDLKPANILLDEAGEPRVSDFGLAKLFAGSETEGVSDSLPASAASPCAAPPEELTLPGQEPGTPPYMAPEQFDPNLGPIRPTTDVWSLGVILYELLTGFRPFWGRSRLELAVSIRGADPMPPRKHQPQLHRRLERIVLRCLAKDPAQRYPTAEALADALQRFQQRPRRLSQLLVVLSVLVLMGALLTPILSNWLRPHPTRSDSSPEQAYSEFQTQTAPFLEQLRRGEAVELVSRADGDRMKMAYFPRDDAIRAVESSEGVRVRGNGYAHYLELLPSVPLSHYRITARVRFDAAAGEDCLWGVYYRYDQEPSVCGLQRYYQAVTVAKENARVRPRPEGKQNYWSYTPQHTLHLFAELLPPSTRIHRDESWVQLNVKPSVPRKVPAELPSQLWVVAILEVSPETVRASFIDAQGGFSLAPLPTTSNADFLNVLRGKHEDLAAIPWFPRPDGSAVGLFLKASICTVSGFRVEPMAVANPFPK